jgi:cellulose synthase (UDP-forming)
MQVLRRENPLAVSGLTVMQRVSYLSTLLGWFDSWRVLGYLLLAPATLLTGGLPVNAPPALFLVAFLTVFWLQRVALAALARGRAPQIPSMVFDVVRLSANLLATFALFGIGGRSFNVTRKGREGDSRRRAPAPPLLVALCVVSTAALLVFAAHVVGVVTVSYPDPWVARGAAAWTVLNLLLLVAALRRIRSPRFGAERRAAVRFQLDGDATLGDRLITVADVSLTGARLTLPGTGTGHPPPDVRPKHVVGLALTVGPEKFELTVRIQSVWPTGDRWDVGVEFLDVSVDDAGRLALALFRTGVTPQVVAWPHAASPST